MGVAVVNVILDGDDHYCCGEHREVGDVVTIEVLNYEGTIYEQRHGGLGLDSLTRPITGTITGIQWRPAIMRHEGYYGRILEGYEPGRRVDTTDYRDPTVTGFDWAFDFALDTDDPIPPPRETRRDATDPHSDSGVEW